MQLQKNLVFAALLILVLGIGAVQGQRLDRIRDTEAFYRWLVNASTHLRRETSLEFEDTALDYEPQDDELFAKVTESSEAFLPDFPIDPEDDVDRTGNPISKLLRGVRQDEDQKVWAFAASDASADLRTEFHELITAGKLQSVGTQFSTATLYEGEGQGFGVGITSMFFGFRKLAANFLWLQVDKFWHAGQLHRMIPLMRTTVTFDPNFVDAYILGAWHMGYNITAKLIDTPEPQKVWHPKYKKRLGIKEEWYYAASEFLKDGIKKNPRDFRLYFDLGYTIYSIKLEDYRNAVVYLHAAMEHPHERWVARMYCEALTDNGQYEDSIEAWNDYLVFFPNYDVALRAIEINEALLAGSNWEEARECVAAAEAAAEESTRLARLARSANDMAAAAQHENEAKAALAKSNEMRAFAEDQRSIALEIWRPLFEVYESDQAEARIAIFEAIEFSEQGRAFEAAAVLQQARWSYPSMFEKISNLRIEIKQKAGLALDVSEELAVQRQKEAAQYLEEQDTAPKIRRVDCGYPHEAPA